MIYIRLILSNSGDVILSGAPEIKKLVDRFERDKESYKQSSYKEAQLRIEFINPFFKELGWDVDNEKGKAPQYRDVITEDSIKIGGFTKAPDYCFSLSGNKIFFVEAKKPSVNIYEDSEPAYQLRRYAWSAKMPLAILTDFEELAIYDTRYKPKKSDSAKINRICYIKFNQYAEKWDKIKGIFSHKAVENGYFDKFAESTKQRGTTEVDNEFLIEIEKWRELFAKNIKLRNKDIELTVEDINYAVQQIIDRIIFLRMGEDRGIEKYGKLKSLLDNKNVYQNFCKLCQEADDKYNSGLFHFTEEKGRNTSVDNLTLRLNIDDGIFKTVIKSIYYPESPYEFSAISPEILGNVYEQFLGKVIKFTKKGIVKIEEKPEVKKAGGVYYTPQFIVDYIVENTVEQLCKDKTPNKVSDLKILDPACGSGSFLLGAYNKLLKWHLDYYLDYKSKERIKDDKIYKGKHGEWLLTIKEKKRILLNNIYGVDIDPQAVEVSKLSLLLKVLEGENKDVLEAQQKFATSERALPDLDSNIKCGNSLIGHEIYDEDLELNTEDERRINAFDWEIEFPDVINGQFDAVIGNPPYIDIQSLSKWAPKEVEFYKKKYNSATQGNFDIYIVFIEKGLNLVNSNGILGFITPHRLFKTEYGELLRGSLLEHKNINKIIDFDGYMVFKASINTSILLLNKKINNSFVFGQMQFYDKLENEVRNILQNEKSSIDYKVGKIPISRLSSKPWVFLWDDEKPLWNKLDAIENRLQDATTKIFQGLKTGGDYVYSGEIIQQNDSTSILSFGPTNKRKQYEIENSIIHGLVKGGQIKRFDLKDPQRMVIFPYIKGQLIVSKEIKQNYPKTWNYLNDFKEELSNRQSGGMRGPLWYAYTRTQALNNVALPKILTPEYYEHASYAFDEDGNHFFFGGGAGGYGIVLKEDYNPKYILGLLNSKLLDWYLHKISMRAFKTAFLYIKKYIKQIPIKTIDLGNNNEVMYHNEIVSKVDRMLNLHKSLKNANNPTDKNRIERQIEFNEIQINNLVYKLYGLTPEEIKIIEDSLDMGD